MSEPYDPYAPRTIKAAERKKREEGRLRESMADAAELSAEMAAAGLISAEAHAETVAIAEAVAEKFGGKPLVNDVEAVAAGELRQFVERIERLEEEQRAINDDKKDVYGEAKSRGYDVKTIKRVIGIRRKDRDQRHEEDAMLDLYLQALGID